MKTGNNVCNVRVFDIVCINIQVTKLKPKSLRIKLQKNKREKTFWKMVKYQTEREKKLINCFK